MLVAENPSRQPAWLPRFHGSHLLHLLMLVLLIYKQGYALKMMAIPPGPAHLAASAGVILFLSGLIRLAAGRWQTAWWLVASAVITLVMYADIVYYRQFGDFVSVAALKQAHQLSTVSDSVTVLMRGRDLLLFADLPVLAGLLALPQGLRTRLFAPARRWAATLVALTGLAMVTLVALFDPILSHHYYGHTMVGGRMGLINYHLFDVGAYTGRLLARFAPNGEAVAQVQAYFQAKRSTEGPPDRQRFFGLAKGKNVIVLQLESFQSFPVGLKVGHQEITPNLNRLMGESVTFTNFYHQTGQGVTADADFLTNCSLHPTRTGAVYYDYAHNRFACMPTLLRENGYKAVAMQGMPADFWNLQAVYPQVGFERYYSIRDFTLDERIGLGLSDQSFVRQAVPKLKALPQPYYAFMVALTSHSPFDFPELPRTLDLGSLEGTKAGHYLHAVHYTDKAVGQFVDQLKAEGILDDAVLVIYGDHQGVWRSESGMQELLQVSGDLAWTKVEKQVPLLIRLPGGKVVEQRTQAAGQADIAPTVAGLLGVKLDQSYFLGRDLFATPGGIVPFYRGSAVDDSHLYLSPDDSSNAGTCYDVTTGAEVDLGRCATLRDQATERLHISNEIISRDLIPALRKR